ncbi:MAG: adenylate/guanylate cyclase domain-containing protein [Alphaproteobacteria bacterium]|jgi:adenylate cyclase|nr:adenylate/guanylate cyclase domain-containing protein [Alphaproteobacteria bacterium]MDP6563752.1 adenylate/guanylate cyclase domain-containing protein [Alphaproteobacteria bacterium]MDP6814359.1 adenylate/guanylate cyclase domain-containing protein [Alphaproteobacteria bacterium]
MWRALRNTFLGRPAEGRLPPRVARAIAAHQLRSEKLIAWAQLLVGVAWSVLYAAAPKTFAAESAIEPVPIALGLYLGFSLLRLALTYRAWAADWFLTLAVVVDMSLLMILIWSFHIQYAQPAAFYLKAPTLLYVFVFIALRALRFSAGYVLLAGAAAGVGWLLLLNYALMTSAEPNMGVTRDYVTYMTSNMILIGAEFDKAITIMLSTAILAVAIVRARRLLVQSVVEEQAHQDLRRFFAPEIARQIVGAEHRIEPGGGEIRQAATLMCDIRGFTPLAMAMEPDELMALLADYESRMVSVIQAHGGSIDKFMGDGIMATFGAAVPTDSYAADALNCIAALGQAAAAWRGERLAAGREPLRIGFAASAGALVFGAVGDAERLEFTVIGEPVNLTAKLEKANKSEDVTALTTTDTLALAERQGFEPTSLPEYRPGRPVEGLDAPVDLVVLLP